MTQNDVVAYIRVSTTSQDLNRQRENLQSIADERQWVIRRFFSEKISGSVRTQDRRGFTEMLDYIRDKGIRTIMVSEISRLGRRVVDVLARIEELHQVGVSLYVQQFNMCSLENGKENPVVKLLIQMLSMGAEMENGLRKERQMQGIKIAQQRGTYKGRSKGACADPAKLFVKHQDIVDLIGKSNLSTRRIAAITKKSANTVTKVKRLLAKNVESPSSTHVRSSAASR